MFTGDTVAQAALHTQGEQGQHICITGEETIAEAVTMQACKCTRTDSTKQTK